jgi:predicted  nucleic acid-binding Zn-ribbon protein
VGAAHPCLARGHRPLDAARALDDAHGVRRRVPGVVRVVLRVVLRAALRFLVPFVFLRSPPLNAAPADQIRLLDVQALDSRIAQLDHRRKNLPEHAELERLNADLAQLRDLLVAARTEDGDTAREQTKAEQDVDQVRQRAARDQQRLDSGVVTSPKDLENLQRELASLAKRQSDLEDIVLEVMERREAAQERAAELAGRVESLEAKTAEAEQRKTEALQAIDAEGFTVAKEREELAATVPGDLLALYDKLRAQQGGVGAARLYQKRCEGCRLELNITELNEMRAAAPDTVVRCENCRRILVRTADSGL